MDSRESVVTAAIFVAHEIGGAALKSSSWASLVCSLPLCTLFRTRFGVLQASGEAVYTSDVCLGGDELYAYPVESTQALAIIESIDASKALEVQSSSPGPS